jgi:hypothetical protein
MLEALKSLFENDVISEDVKASIQEAWDQQVKENKLAVTAELREEFASKYEHDKAQMVEAIDQLVSDKLSEEISEFAEDRKQLAEARAKYAVAMRENANLLKGFVFEQLKKEVGELHEDQKVMSDKFGKLEEFVVEALAKEIAEFHEDKKDLAETKVRLVREAKDHLAKVRKTFVERSAKLVSETVGKSLKKEIGQLKEDIDSARKNDFGRKIFETFAQEYNNSYLNEKSETAKLMKVVALKDKAIEEAKVEAEEVKKIVESKDAEIAKIADAAKRKEVMHELTGPLSKDQREIMTDLLESVQTDKLQSAFDKYLPAVIDGRTPEKKKATLTESEAKEITGNKVNTNVSSVSSEVANNIVDIRRLAGLK